MGVYRVEAMDEILDITHLNLTDVWKHEANDFTPWLASDVGRLSEALGLNLELVGTEVSVGPFFADIVLRDQSSGKVVVVENMLGATDHDHLGKMITYAAGLGASHAVLVASEFRPEHKSALHWLNAAADETSFFGIEVSAIRIGESPPAAQLKVVVEPDDWSRQSRPELSDSQKNYQDVWAAFLPVFHDRHPGWSNAKKPQTSNWINVPSGTAGVRYGASFAWPLGSEGHRLRVELYIDSPGDGAPDKVFYHLLNRRSELEETVGAVLEWERLETNRSRRIAMDSELIVDPSDRDSWPDHIEWMTESVGRLRQAFEPALLVLQKGEG